MTPEDLDKELDRLWSKVGSEAEPASTFLPSSPSMGMTQEITLETIALLKRQHQEQARRWQAMLEAKEQALGSVKGRLEAAESELFGFKRRLQDEEDRRISDSVEVHAKLDAGMKSLAGEREEFSQERRSLEAILEATRQRLASDTMRFKESEREWRQREEQYLADLKDLQALTTRYQEEAGRSREQSGRLSDDIKDAKASLERSLTELQRERALREDTEKERERAIKKVDEVEKRFKELSQLWEEERAQWRELWDRERSTWETQRAEFSSWEESLRKEREAWQAELKTQERSQYEFTAKVNETLRQSAETSTKLARTLKLLLGLEAAVSAGEETGLRLAKPLRWAALAAALLASAWPVWTRLSRPRLTALSTQVLALDNPTAMAYDGALLTVAEYDGRLLSYDPGDPGKPVREAKIAGLGPYRPAGLAVGGDQLWSLDSAQARLVRHKAAAPAQVLGSVPAPGPAPAGLAFDGQALWSYDAAAGALYRHEGEGDAKPFVLGPDTVPGAMAWAAGKLWIYDSKSRDLLVMELKDGSLRERWRLAFAEQALGLAAVRVGSKGDGSRELWVLAAPSAERPGHALIRYKY